MGPQAMATLVLRIQPRERAARQAGRVRRRQDVLGKNRLSTRVPRSRETTPTPEFKSQEWVREEFKRS